MKKLKAKERKDERERKRDEFTRWAMVDIYKDEKLENSWYRCHGH